jgi:hypothetical protein
MPVGIYKKYNSMGMLCQGTPAKTGSEPHPVFQPALQLYNPFGKRFTFKRF